MMQKLTNENTTTFHSTSTNKHVREMSQMAFQAEKCEKFTGNFPCSRRQVVPSNCLFIFVIAIHKAQQTVNKNIREILGKRISLEM